MLATPAMAFHPSEIWVGGNHVATPAMTSYPFKEEAKEKRRDGTYQEA